MPDGSPVTTNKSIRGWIVLIAGDEVLATAILDRLLRCGRVLNIKDRSYRLLTFEEALKGCPHPYRTARCPRGASLRRLVRPRVALARKAGCRLTGGSLPQSKLCNSSGEGVAVAGRPWLA